jgi:rhodanese-related sulfurtransferase
MTIKKFSTFLFSASLFLLFGLAQAGDEAFPHRAKFKDVAIMELDQLRQQLNQVTVVDVRSRYEYDTLHIKGALHIPLSKEKLPTAVRELRSKSPKTIVFYCNGHSCKKSYEAAELAMKAGVTKVYAYDAGIDTWIKHHPDQSVLLGRNPVQAGDFIPKDAFKKHLIAPKEFDAIVERGGALVLDIRDLRQRDVALFPMREMRATLDEAPKLLNAVMEAKRQKKTLYVYDKVGKQTRWFQYFLEQQGLKDYYFLDGGAEGYYEARFGKLNLPKSDS